MAAPNIVSLVRRTTLLREDVEHLARIMGALPDPDVFGSFTVLEVLSPGGSYTLGWIFPDEHGSWSFAAFDGTDGDVSSLE